MYYFFRKFYTPNQYDIQYETGQNIHNGNDENGDPSVPSFKFTSKNETNCDTFIFESKVNNSNLRNRNKNKSVLNEYVYSDKTVIDKDVDGVSNLSWKGKDISESPIWCMDYCNDLIILGCADGRLEFWEATSGKLMVIVCVIQIDNKVFRIHSFRKKGTFNHLTVFPNYSGVIFSGTLTIPCKF